jgi:hypothetical protein
MSAKAAATWRSTSSCRRLPTAATTRFGAMKNCSRNCVSVSRLTVRTVARSPAGIWWAGWSANTVFA